MPSPNPELSSIIINSMEDLSKLLASFAQDKKESLMEALFSSPEHKINTLIASASPEELSRFIDENGSELTLKYLSNHLSEQEFIQMCQKYSYGDPIRLFTIIKALGVKGDGPYHLDGSKFQTLLSVIMDTIPDQFKSTFSMLKRNPLEKKIGLVMGLSGDAYEASSMGFGNSMTKQRFENSFSDSETLPFHLVGHYQNDSDFYNPIQQHGDLHGVHAGWKGHAFSFHLIKDGEKTHLVYVNRGQKHELAKANDSTVSVFSFTEQEALKPPMTKLLEVLKTEDRTVISEFINHSLLPYKNDLLSLELKKSNQKVGNCTVANANIAWHFALAAREMKKTQCSFSEAYKSTKVAYKDMRMEDRAKTFCDLMTSGNDEMISAALPQIIAKMAEKDRKGRETIRFLLERLNEKNPDAVLTLLDHMHNVHADYLLKWVIPCGAIFPNNPLIQDKIATLVGGLSNWTIESAILHGKHTEIVPYINDHTLLRLLEHQIISPKDLSDTQKENNDVVKILLANKHYHHIGNVAASKLLQTKQLRLDDLSDTQKRTLDITEACKDELIRILKKGAYATTSVEKKDVISYLIKQVERADNLDKLIPIMYAAERTFSHVRNPLLSRNRGGSQTDSYKATSMDFELLREAIGKSKELHAATEIIQDTPSAQSKCLTYKQMVQKMHDEPLSEMNANTEGKSESEGDDEGEGDIDGLHVK